MWAVWPATIKGKAVIDGTTASSTLSTTGVSSGFVCNGEHVQVQKMSTGYYEVVFGDKAVNRGGNLVEGIPSYASDDVVMITPQSSGIVAYAQGSYQCASSPPPYVLCYLVHVTNLSGTATDGHSPSP